MKSFIDEARTKYEQAMTGAETSMAMGIACGNEAAWAVTGGLSVGDAGSTPATFGGNVKPSLKP